MVTTITIERRRYALKATEFGQCTSDNFSLTLILNTEQKRNRVRCRTVENVMNNAHTGANDSKTHSECPGSNRGPTDRSKRPSRRVISLQSAALPLSHTHINERYLVVLTELVHSSGGAADNELALRERQLSKCHSRLMRTSACLTTAPRHFGWFRFRSPSALDPPSFPSIVLLTPHIPSNKL